MAATYTPNYHLGKQEDRSDKFVMKIITDNMDVIDEQLKATDDKATAAAAGLKYKGAVNYYNDLPNDAEIGDAYTVLYAGSSGTVPDGTEYVWGELNGTAQWIDFSKDTYTKAEVDALLTAKQALLNANNKLNPAYINYDSTHRAVSDTEKSTWNSKQNAIDSSHKLSADLVDDTSATNKFATAAELEQIETNKNNISLLSGGGRNVFKFTNLSGSNNEVSYITNSDGSITVTVASTVAANRELALTSAIENAYDGMKLSGSPAIATGDVEYLITGLKADGSYQNEQFSYNAAVTTINRGTPKIKFSIYVKAGTAAGTYTFYPMIQSADNQTAFPTFTPYIPTLGDIAEMIANP